MQPNITGIYSEMKRIYCNGKSISIFVSKLQNAQFVKYTSFHPFDIPLLLFVSGQLMIKNIMVLLCVTNFLYGLLTAYSIGVCLLLGRTTSVTIFGIST
jgi:hypothetical protein